MAVMDMRDLVRIEQASQVAGHLMRTQMGSVSKHREELTELGIWGFWLIAREGTKVARGVGDMINACEHIQQVGLGGKRCATPLPKGRGWTEGRRVGSVGA